MLLTGLPVNEMIANARFWGNFPYATTTHVANVIVETKYETLLFVRL